MKRKIMRVIAFVICISMVSSISTYAVSNNGIDPITQQGIYEQLEGQNALDVLDIHEYVYSTTNPIAVPYGSEDEYTNVYAPHGGTMEYKTTINGRTVEIANTYWDFDDSYYYVLGQQEIGVGDVIVAILGYIPFVGPLASTVANATALVNSAAATSIINAGGYTQVTLTKYSDGTVSTVGGWTRYPYMYLYDIWAMNIRTTKFPENNPFDQ